MPVGPPLYFYTVGVDELTNQLLVPDFDGNTFGAYAAETIIPYRAIKIDDGKTVYKVVQSSNITALNALSVHLVNDNTNYLTTGTAKVILTIIGSSTTVTDFEVLETSTADATTGTQKEDFPSVSLGSTLAITTKVLEFTSGKYITVKSNTGTINTVFGYVIE